MLHVVPNVWGMLLGAPLMQLGKGETPFVHGQMELPNTSPQAAELNPSCLGQAHPNRPGTGPGHKNMEPEVFSQYSTFHLWFLHLEVQMPSPARLSKKFCAAGTNGCLDLSLSC